MVDQVVETLQKHHMVRRGDLVLIAFSGGPDSLALLHLLKNLRERLGITLHAAHLDHGLRGEASAKDAVWVAELCRAWDIPCTLGYWEGHDQPLRGLSPEEAARQARLEFLQETMEKTGAAVIAQGHHGDDQAETLIIRLLNGAGTGGLGGIRPVRGPYIRPLLEITRREILDYCQVHGLEPRQDDSNLSDDFLRNRLRHHVMPLLKELNPSLISTLGRTAQVLQSEDDYLDRLAKEKLKRAAETAGLRSDGLPGDLPLSGLMDEEPVLARRMIRQWSGLPLDFGSVQRVMQLAASGRTGSQVDLTGRYYVRKTYSALRLERRIQDGQQACAPQAQRMPLRASLSEPVPIPSLHGVLTVRWLPRLQNAADLQACPGPGECRALSHGGLIHEGHETSFCLPWDLAAGLPVIRGRQPGDWIQFPYGRKKLKDWFIDQKIPSEKRACAVILAAGQQVLWIPGQLRAKGPFAEDACDGCLFFEIRKIK
jgi:tRNA(Ile)-lysidine synthase